MLVNHLLASIPNEMKSIETQYFEDTTESITLPDILNHDNQYVFTDFRENVVSDGDSEAVCWVRFKLIESAKESLILAVSGGPNSKSELFVPVYTNNKLNFVSANNKTGYFTAFILPENIDADEYVYVKLGSSTYTKETFNLFTETLYDRIMLFTYLIFGLSIGAMVLLGVFITWAYITILRKKYFTFYILVLTFNLISLLEYTGQFTFLKAKDFNTELSIFYIFYNLTVTFYFMFLKDVFLSKTDYKLETRIFNFGTVFSLFVIIICLLGNPLISKVLSTILMAYTLISVYYVLAFLSIKGASGARLSFFSILTASLASLYAHSKYLSYLDLSIYSSFGPLICLALTYFLFALGIFEIYKDESASYKNAKKQLKVSEELAKLNELEFLRAQIKPHFLHNSINSIAAICRFDPLLAQRRINDLSEYLIYSLSLFDKDELIPLKEEINFVKAYVNLETERFRNAFLVEYDIEDELTLPVPPFILQPLVENAILHGVRKSDHIGKVRIAIKKMNAGYCFEVFDDGKGMSEKELNSLLNKHWERGCGIGVVNINHRLNILYGTKLEYESVPGKGTIVRFKIPINNNS